MFMLRTTPRRVILTTVVLMAVMLSAHAKPLLHCHVEQGDTVADMQIAPTTDPYLVKARQINHFLFKAVVIGQDDRIDYINLYTYYDREEGRAPALLHQAKYLAPSPSAATPSASLTGTVYLYEPALGREFMYDCALREEKQ